MQLEHERAGTRFVGEVGKSVSTSFRHFLSFSFTVDYFSTRSRSSFGFPVG